MATLRQLRTRVGSIRNIQRVTNAMQMVAAAKMRRAQEAIEAARPYARQLDAVLHHLSGSSEAGEHPLLVPRSEIRKVALVVVTADRGLCGGFNSNIGRHALARLRQHEGREVELVAVGRKGRDFLRNRGHAPASEHLGLFQNLRFSQAAAIAHELTQRFLQGEIDLVELVFSEFRSVAHQQPVVTQLLPVAAEEGQGGGTEDYLFEPGPRELLESLVPRHVNFQVWRALLESNAGEQAARMQAMDSATKNAGDLMDELTREMNKVRQTSITLELMDIVGGAEAVAQ